MSSVEVARNRFVGFKSMLSIGLIPWGHRAAIAHRNMNGPDRLAKGLVLVFPGIDGPSSVNDGIARGLLIAGVPYAVQIMDWRSSAPWNPFHLTRIEHNRRQAKVIADHIKEYQRQYPERPIHLIGHSAGAGMALFAMELLEDNSIETAMLLSAAVSRRYVIAKSLKKVKRGIWNFWSRGDFPTLGIGTMIFGTMDRVHAPAIGAFGSTKQPNQELQQGAQLHEVGFSWQMIRNWNFGGHFGQTNASFVAHYLAPILQVESIKCE